MEQLTDHQYEVLTVPEEAAANCVYIKGTSPRLPGFLLHRPAEECPDSASVRTPGALASLVEGSHQQENKREETERLYEYGLPVFNTSKRCT